MENKDLYVVGIGASAGGLDAIQQLFDNLPSDTGFTFVIVQHLSPDYKSLMPELLAKHTSMKIYTAEDNQTIKPNCIYLNPKSNNLLIKGRKLFLADKSPRPNLNLPIDIFFHTLGEEYKDRAVGVILSGTGSDGSRGIKTIKEAGGTLYVQDPVSAQFDGMPNSSIFTNLVDYILHPAQIAETLVKTESNRIKLSTEGDEVFKSNEIVFYKILDEIHQRYGIDFKQYKKNTLLRRLEKRMNISNVEKLYDYYIYLKNHKKELEKLKQDFLIGVTSFFRDVEAFEQMKNVVIPDICNRKEHDSEPIRVWVAGCSTGEEVFTLAILFDNYIKMKRLDVDFKIFATDIDEKALEQASVAQFAANDVREMLKEYVDTYFVQASKKKLAVINELREHIVFSQHDVLKDPPFIKMDLISCRNMLIYFENIAQRKVLMNFQFSLNLHGFLLLGNSESLGTQAKFFKVIDTKWKIFQNIFENKRLPMQDLEMRYPTCTKGKSRQLSIPRQVEFKFKENPENVFYKYIGQEFGPTMVFIDNHFNVLFVNGDITSRLSVKAGLFESNLLKMVNADMVPIIRRGIKKVTKENIDVIIKDVKNRVGEQEFCFDLGFKKLRDMDSINISVHGVSQVFIVYFSEDKAIDESRTVVLDNFGAGELSKQHIELMETELRETKIKLQNVVEELETSNEELQSSNEELMASNEELQSTNEELQSVNEELYSVNAELQEKNKELSLLNNDVNNLLNSTEIGTLFLDVDLRIRKFTPALKKHFNLQEEDIGRTISSFASSFTESDRKSIITDCKESLEHLTSIETEVWDELGKCYLRKISPFITYDKKIEGVVIAFVDISKHKDAETQLRQSEHKYRQLFNNQLSSIAVYEVIYDGNGNAIDLRYIDGNDKFAEFLHIPKKKFIGKKISEIRQGFIQNNRQLFERYVRVAETGKSESFEMHFKDSDTYHDIKVFSFEKGIGVTIADDITKRKTAENQLKYSDEILKKEKNFTDMLLGTSPNGIYIYDITKKKYIFVNKQCHDILGYNAEELQAMDKLEIGKLFHPEDIEAVVANVEKVASGHEGQSVEYRFKHKNGQWVWCYTINRAFEKDKDGNVVSVIGSIIDLSSRKAFETELKIAKQRAEVANIYKNQFLANMSHEIRTPINGIVGFADLLKEENLSQHEKEKYVQIIQNSSKQLLLLINDIIDISKIEAGELKLTKQPCRVAAMIENLKISYNELKKQKDKSHIKFVAKIPAEYYELVIETDPFRLKQVLSNLINNALKFSEEGKIEFGYEVKNDKIVFFVSDQGIGISKENIKLIFKRFEQLDNDDPGKNEGTGLGLSISKGIINLLGGKMYIESEEKKGSTFYVELPLNDLNMKIEHEEGDSKLQNGEHEALRGLIVLIAEDEDINMEYFKQIMQHLPCSVIYANNGQEAVKFYFDNPDIDIVLMDIKMPIMNGEDAAIKILSKYPDAKIISQTAYAMEADREKFLELGFVEHISKPINKEELIRKIIFCTKREV